MLRTLSNGNYLLTEETKYPSPDLVIEKVTQLSDIKYLCNENPSTSDGVLYVYVDRGKKNSRFAYVGETKKSPSERFINSHQSSDWLNKMDRPTIFAIRSPYKGWDTDTRRDIEGMVANSLYEKYDFELANKEAHTWLKPGEPRVDGVLSQEEIYAIVDIIVQYVVFEVGATMSIVRNPDTDEEDINTDSLKESIENTPVGPIRSRSSSSNNELWEPPKDGRRLIISHNGTTIKGIQTNNGRVIVTSIQNFSTFLPPYAPKKAQQRLHTLLKTAIQNEDGSYSWEGKTEPERPVGYLVFAGLNSNLWKEEKDEILDTLWE